MRSFPISLTVKASLKSFVAAYEGDVVVQSRRSATPVSSQITMEHLEALRTLEGAATVTPVVLGSVNTPWNPSVNANRIIQGWHDGYLNGRKAENEAEVPVMYVENQAYLRGKAAQAIYALQDLLGKEKVHRALRNFIKDYSFQTSPCPTSRDLVNALRAEAGLEYGQLIADLFERIVLYDLQVDAAGAREIAGGYETTVEITAKQFADDGHGKETEEPLDSWFDVAVFAEADEPLDAVTPLYIEKHRFHSRKQVLTLRTSKKPGVIALDPFHKRIERNKGNNSRIVLTQPGGGSGSPG